MTDVVLTQAEIELLTYLSRKTGPVFVSDEHHDALMSLHDKGLVAIFETVAQITDVGRIALQPDENVRKHLEAWSKLVSDPDAEKRQYEGGFEGTDPLAIAIRRKLRSQGIDPNRIYPMSIGTKDFAPTDDVKEGTFKITFSFGYDKA